MTKSDTITRNGSSSKRQALWNGMTVGFNKAHTQFFEELEHHMNDSKQMDSNGGRFILGRELFLTDEEKSALLNTWRQGKAAWYQANAALPLRGNAEKAKAHFNKTV